MIKILLSTSLDLKSTISPLSYYFTKIIRWMKKIIYVAIHSYRCSLLWSVEENARMYIVQIKENAMPMWSGSHPPLSLTNCKISSKVWLCTYTTNCFHWLINLMLKIVYVIGNRKGYYFGKADVYIHIFVVRYARTAKHITS